MYFNSIVFIHSDSFWNRPVLSNECKIPCWRKNRDPQIGLKQRLRYNRDNHWNTLNVSSVLIYRSTLTSEFRHSQRLELYELYYTLNDVLLPILIEVVWPWIESFACSSLIAHTTLCSCASVRNNNNIS